MNGMRYLHKIHTISPYAQQKSSSRSVDKTIQELHTVTNMYKSRGFNINVYHGENEFNVNALKEHIRP